MLNDLTKIEQVFKASGVALTQISAYVLHKNLAVRKIMGAMHTAYAKSGTFQNSLRETITGGMQVL